MVRENKLFYYVLGVKFIQKQKKLKSNRGVVKWEVEVGVGSGEGGSVGFK